MAKDFFNGKKLSFKEMLSYINKDFYKLVTTKRELTEFTRQLTDAYCDEKNISPVTITSTNFKKSHFATYFRFTGEIKINNLLLKGFDHFKETENLYFVQEYFDTILHELRHHEQFVSACKDFNPVVKYSAQIMRRYRIEQLFDLYSYHCNPTEIDARYFAYQQLKSIEDMKPYFLSDNYRDEEITGQTNGALDYVSLFKEKALWKAKGITKPLRLLEKSVREIAGKYRLQFTSNSPRQTNLISWTDGVNSVKLSERVSASIAPEFYSDDFILTDNPEDVEEKIENEVEDYHKFVDSIIRLERARRKALREEKKKEQKAEQKGRPQTDEKPKAESDESEENCVEQ